VPDDVNHPVQVQIRNQQAVQDVEPVGHGFQAEAEPFADRFRAKGQPFGQQARQGLDRGFAVQADHVEIDPAGPLQFRDGKQMQHEGVDVHPG
jgi:hypothetical protein